MMNAFKAIGPPAPLRWLAAFLLSVLVMSHAEAQVTFQLQQTVDRPTASIDGEVFEFLIDYSCISTLEAANQAEMICEFSTELDVVSISGSAHTTLEEPSATGKKVFFTFVDPLPAGATGQLRIQASFPAGTNDGDIVDMVSTMDAQNGSMADSGKIYITAVSSSVWLPQAFETGASIYKWAGSSSIALPSEPGAFYIKHGNTGAVGEDISYVIEDVLPAGMELVYLGTGSFANAAVPIKIAYRTNLNATWRSWEGFENAGGNYLYPDGLGLPAGEYVNGVQLHFDTLPGGGACHPDHPDNQPITVRLKVAADHNFVGGETIENTARLTGNGTGTGIGTAVAAADPSLLLVVGSDSPLASRDQGRKTLMEGWGYTVAVIDDGESQAFFDAAMATADVVYVSGTVGGGTLADKVTGSLAPIVTEFPGKLDNFGFSSGTSATVVSSAFSSTAASHYITEPYGGDPVTVFSTSLSMPVPNGTLAPDLQSVGEFGANLALVTLDLAALRWDGQPAPARRVHLPFGAAETTDLTADGEIILRRAIEWAAAAEGGGSIGSAVDESSSATMVVGTPAADYDFFDWDATGTGPYSTGDRITIHVGIGSTNRNGVTMKDPNFAWLMPAEMDYVGNESFEGTAWSKMGSPLPLIEQIPDFAGTGRTLIRYSWNGREIAPSGEHDHIYTYFEVEVNASAVNGTSAESELYGGWQQPQGQGWHWNVVDDLDYDGDGDSTEWIAKDVDTFEFDINPGSGVASLDAVLWVKGALDMKWNRYPEIGMTTPGGQADYELRLTNTGGVALKDITIIDIFPHVGDTGVVQVSEERGSQWAPFLAGEVSAPNGVTVSYSDSSQPERYELVSDGPPGSEPPGWVTGTPADLTSVGAVKFEFGANWLAPGEEIVLSWPMRVPTDVATDGAEAWNSFGFVASRADDGGQLLPSEPVKVGIAAQPAEGAYYGDWVWDDENRNGLIDPNEVGVAGVRIELYKDNGDYVADPDVDELVSYTITGQDGESDGKYLFANLDAGRYFTVVYLKEGFAASIPPGNPGDATNVLEFTPDDGSFESGTGDWWALPKMRVEPTGGAQDGGAHVEIYNRNKASHGVDLRIENLVQENRLYTLELYAKVRNVQEDLQIRLLTNGFDVVSEITATIEPGFAEGDRWTRVTGVLQTYLVDLTQPHTLSIRTTTSAQDFKFDQVSIKEFDFGLDSDGIRSYVSGMPVAVLPVTDLATGEQQLNWDQGIVQIGQGQPAVWAVAHQGDGRYIVGGQFTAVHGEPRRNIARLLENGQIDPTFDPGSGTNHPISTLTLLSNGCTVAGGGFTEYDGVPVNGLVCIDQDGSLVGGIAQPDIADIRWMTADPKGRLLVAGGFSSIGGERRRSIARLNADGSIDPSFQPLDIGGPINGGALLDDGRIAIVGEFKEVAGRYSVCVAILDEYGVPVSDFQPEPGSDGPIYTVSPKAGGKLLLAGDFRKFNGVNTNGTVRIDMQGKIDTDLGPSQLDISTIRKSQ